MNFGLSSNLTFAMVGLMGVVGDITITGFYANLNRRLSKPELEKMR